MDAQIVFELSVGGGLTTPTGMKTTVGTLTKTLEGCWEDVEQNAIRYAEQLIREMFARLRDKAK